MKKVGGRGCDQARLGHRVEGVARDDRTLSKLRSGERRSSRHDVSSGEPQRESRRQPSAPLILPEGPEGIPAARRPAWGSPAWQSRWQSRSQPRWRPMWRSVDRNGANAFPFGLRFANLDSHISSLDSHISPIATLGRSLPGRLRRSRGRWRDGVGGVGRLQHKLGDLRRSAQRSGLDGDGDGCRAAGVPRLACHRE